jgi:hypothetical protein
VEGPSYPVLSEVAMRLDFGALNVRPHLDIDKLIHSGVNGS